MALSYNQFTTMCALSEAPCATQRELSEATQLGLATVNATLKECVAAGYIDNKRLSAKGMAELKPYEVDNAVIMAPDFPAASPPFPTSARKGSLRFAARCLSSVRSSNSKPRASTKS